ncbi:L,D-transpeptidase [Paenibacillus mucilaginosus]|uniref:YkuD n=1 Tax=Paenibacillus mucilaginosus (strain KNP414) TaxID=1036673 RepID=F8FCG3_PAEMK|nr:L,D-transpeptidase [Paenibacillus mucilaginosus]AEI45282.1 YkuD [Paenibacillus mucilaginosus KNP414]MCG7212832.1 L,D-transpeptidase [Paenibacillus mucilaginosus]WDM26746.1 L,D-transpeptidase [Paenibacillus mucilaginosus]
MPYPTTRYRVPKADHLIHLHKNLYLNRNDPNYYQKVINYLDRRSPEAHFRLAQHYEGEGRREKALFHYRETMRTHPSPYYYLASGSIRRLEKEAGLAESAEVPAASKDKPVIPLFLKVLLLALLFINLLLAGLFYGPAAISKVVSVWSPLGIGKAVTYESVELPFLLHIPYGTPNEEVEELLHDRAVQLSEGHPKNSIVIFGIASPVAGKSVVPLTDETWKSKAFVVAEYQPAVDDSVKIRFLQAELQKLRTEAGANLVRTALAAYKSEHGAYPASVQSLLSAYPSNYISFLPEEALSGSSEVRAFFDGSGGWVYQPGGSSPEGAFYPNVTAAAAEGIAAAAAAGGSGSGDGGGEAPEQSPWAVPYRPAALEVIQDQHVIRLTAGEALLAEYPVGLGAEGATPNGSFAIGERVLAPQGRQEGVYGAAALGMGRLAVHGTSDASSVGRDASLGCIRMTNEDIAALYPLVPRGTQVVIRPAEAAETAAHAALPARTVVPAQALLPAEYHRPSASASSGSGSASPVSAVPASSSPAAAPQNETAPGRIFHWLG